MLWFHIHGPVDVGVSDLQGTRCPGSLSKRFCGCFAS